MTSEFPGRIGEHLVHSLYAEGMDLAHVCMCFAYEALVGSHEKSSYEQMDERQGGRMHDSK